MCMVIAAQSNPHWQSGQQSFNHKRDSLEDASWKGCPAAIHQEMIDHVERLVLNYHRIQLANLLQNVVFLIEVLTP